ncbi:MAG: hypothetical protein CVV08_10990 [Gammaproteobacteria bacterium HGW-Gammaproteobacteria-12]|nr:MAG: hypothetical protein CVV08_10990 [Gammaproteobacteria bacterium HGW-Gammaproteobacteria-12]
MGNVLLSIEQRCNRSRQSGSCGWDKAHTKSAALYTGNAETETTPLATPPGVRQVRGNVAIPRTVKRVSTKQRAKVRQGGVSRKSGVYE